MNTLGVESLVNVWHCMRGMFIVEATSVLCMMFWQSDSPEATIVFVCNELKVAKYLQTLLVKSTTKGLGQFNVKDLFFMSSVSS